MARYYRTNAVYEELDRRGGDRFLWLSGNAWILVYGDSDSVPQLVVLVSGASALTAGDREARTRALARELAARAGLPFATITFDDRAKAISAVPLNGTATGLDALKAWFADAGLPVRTAAGAGAAKAINDRSSSAHHNWQRSEPGRVTVSDIDLVRLDAATDAPARLYELKRSHVPLDRWMPYPADFANFGLLHRFAAMAGLDFRIAYNVRHKTPTIFDDAGMLTIFTYAPGPSVRFEATRRFDDFAPRVDAAARRSGTSPPARG